MNKQLYSKSIQIILENQSAWGSYIASPAFPTYSYCWLRDSSFIAHAMDRAGEYASGRAFFLWVGNTLQKHAPKLAKIRACVQAGIRPGRHDMLHTRYTLEGNEDTSDDSWGNFQIDGYGTWLWALAEHVRLSGDRGLLAELAGPLQTTLEYLELVWQLPNYDCWEEYPDYLHPYTLANVYAGFEAFAGLERDGLLPGGSQASALAGQVKDFILKYCVDGGRLVKHVLPAQNGALPQPLPQSGVDASLIAFATPFHVLALDDPLLKNTLSSIEAELHRPGGGVYRYKADVYYGGGEWLLLAAWLGWYYVQTGETARAEALLAWIEAQADGEGRMPEQVSQHTLAPVHYKPWLKKWGPVAKPLLWSHAMYIILANALQEGKTQ